MSCSISQSDSSSSMSQQGPIMPLQSSPFGPDAFLTNGFHVPQTPPRRRTKAAIPSRPTRPPCQDSHCPFVLMHTVHGPPLFEFDKLPWVKAALDTEASRLGPDMADLSQIDIRRPSASASVVVGPIRRKRTKTAVRSTPVAKRGQLLPRLDFPLCSQREPRTPSRRAPFDHLDPSNVMFRKLMPLSPFSAATAMHTHTNST